MNSAGVLEASAAFAVWAVLDLGGGVVDRKVSCSSSSSLKAYRDSSTSSERFSCWATGEYSTPKSKAFRCPPFVRDVVVAAAETMALVAAAAVLAVSFDLDTAVEADGSFLVSLKGDIGLIDKDVLCWICAFFSLDAVNSLSRAGDLVNPRLGSVLEVKLEVTPLYSSSSLSEPSFVNTSRFFTAWNEGEG